MSSFWTDLNTMDWIIIITPMLAGVAGVATALTVVIKWIRRLTRRIGRSMDIADKARIEQVGERKTIAELEQKINFLIEEAKKRDADEKKQK